MNSNFQELFDRLSPALLRYARRLAGIRSDAEEIVQDTFLKLHAQLVSGIEIPNPRAWLFRVITNAVRDLERERRVRAREDGLIPSVNVVDLETYVAQQQLVRRALARLPRRMRQVLLLWSEGFSYREIAEITAIEPGYVGVLLQRARGAFKKEYERGNAATAGGRGSNELL